MRVRECYKLWHARASSISTEPSNIPGASIVSIVIMRFSLLQIGAALGLAASVSASSPGRNVFERAEQLRAKAPIIEKREIGKPFEHPRLQKRASPYLNNVTESESFDHRYSIAQ